MGSKRLRSTVRVAVALLCVGMAASATAKKQKEHPVKTNPGGASQKWACEQLAEYACDLAKRCEPDRSLRHCRKLRDRCSKVKERPSHTATEDDVSVCAQAVGDMSCKQVGFDNASGVSFDLKKLEICSVVAKDNPMPPVTAGSKGDKDDDDSATAKDKGGDEDE